MKDKLDIKTLLIDLFLFAIVYGSIVALSLYFGGIL